MDKSSGRTILENIRKNRRERGAKVIESYPSSSSDSSSKSKAKKRSTANRKPLSQAKSNISLYQKENRVNEDIEHPPKPLKGFSKPHQSPQTRERRQDPRKPYSPTKSRDLKQKSVEKLRTSLFLYIFI